ncbi:hypothetical protein NIES4071_102920 (plasmid) [Calothrix sp. NIES-4071]|nr:hypothetical protein NIES4071_102920 [Calothrix sp. NIES-4071]BAZ64673.1 hypothetical protein NIES4105_104060 [Calothrix sp. NIES-4105]
MENISTNQAVKTTQALKADIVSIEIENPVMLTELIGFIRCKINLKNGQSSQAVANFFLTKEGTLKPKEVSIEEAETLAITKALAYIGYNYEIDI